MSRYYEMYVTINGGNPKRHRAIQAAADREWEFDDWHITEKQMSAGGRGNLCGGESEEQFTERLSVEIWKANEGRYCVVNIVATYLENLPCESYELDEAHYMRYKAQGLLDEKKGEEDEE